MDMAGFINWSADDVPLTLHKAYFQIVTRVTYNKNTLRYNMDQQVTAEGWRERSFPFRFHVCLSRSNALHWNAGCGALRQRFGFTRGVERVEITEQKLLREKRCRAKRFFA